MNFSERWDKRHAFLALAVLSLAPLIRHTLKLPQDRNIRAVVQPDKQSVKNVLQPREPKLTLEFYFESITFPEHEYLRYADKTPIGFGSDFFMDLEARFEVFRPGKYTFSVVSDDGFQLLIDDREVIAHPGDRPARETRAQFELSAGIHTAKLSYFQGYGPAALKMTYQEPDSTVAVPFGETTSAVQFLEYP